MRYVRIFFLHFQYVFEQRGKSFVWLLVSLINPFILLIYWRAALRTNNIYGWSLSSLSTYYFLLIIAAAMLMSHIDEAVSEEDISEGRLVTYIIKPFSYFWYNFIREIPWRLLQGFFGIFSCVLFFMAFGNFISISWTLNTAVFTLIVLALAYLLSFTFKIFIGLLAFWLTDISGFYQVIEIVMLVMAGYILPLDAMNSSLRLIANLSPFPFMIYYPVLTLQGKLGIYDLLSVIYRQIFWIMIFAVAYKITWNKGLKKFTGLGQ